MAPGAGRNDRRLMSATVNTAVPTFGTVALNHARVDFVAHRLLEPAACANNRKSFNMNGVAAAGLGKVKLARVLLLRSSRGDRKSRAQRAGATLGPFSPKRQRLTPVSFRIEGSAGSGATPVGGAEGLFVARCTTTRLLRIGSMGPLQYCNRQHLLVPVQQRV